MLDLRRAAARRTALVLAVAALALSWLAGGLPAPQAAAAEIDGAITDVTVTPAAAGPGDPIRVDVHWAVPDSAGAGDTFTLTLPPQLTSLSAGFDVTAPDGSVVATAQLVDGVVTFTLTDYADTHGALHGAAFFAVKWDLDVVPTTGPVDLDFTTSTQVFHDTVTKTPGVGTVDRTVPRKSGHWVVNGVTTGPDALQWVIDSPDGPFDRATFADTPGPGQAIDCSTVEYQLGSQLDATGHAATFRPLAPGKLISATCSATGLTVVAGPVLADQIIRIRYAVSITDPGLASYTNAVDVTVDSTRYGTVTDRVKVPSSGGDGSGTSSTTTSSSSTTSSTTTPFSTTGSSTTRPASSTAPSSTTAPASTTAGRSTSRPPGSVPSGPTVPALAFTGADVGPLLVLAATLLASGLVLATAGRSAGPRPRRKH